jgi:RNA polymerase sigma-70 factor (ECF subfamily)
LLDLLKEMGQDNKYSDDRLIRDLCREGVDKEAFEHLFHRYYPMVLNFVKGLVKNPVVAEDIAQNTFAKLWLNRFSLQPGQSVKNYLCVLSRNESINFLRSAVACNRSFNLQNDSRAQSPTIEEWMNFTETSNIIKAHIDALPPQRRMVFMMSRYDHMSNMEIAVKLNLSVRTVEKHIELALKDLRHSMS